MGKNKNRQPDITDDASLHSSESENEQNSGSPKCSHIGKSVCAKKLKKFLKTSGILTECKTCEKIKNDESSSAQDNKKQEEKQDQDEDEEGFVSMPPPLWICLQCGNQACGRTQRQHAKQHFETPHSDKHSLAIESHNWQIWCYECDNDVPADSTKPLLETVEFIKKLATTSYTPSQPVLKKLPSIEQQQQQQQQPPDYNKLTKLPSSSSSPTKDKQKILTNLTRVGGLMNLGNTCFFNSVMQCLAQTPFLVKVLEDLREPGEKFHLPGGKFKLTDNENTDEQELPIIEGTLDGWGNFTSILHKTLVEMQNSDSNQTYRPSELLNSFKRNNPHCMDGGQHDSHELLRHLLELVRSDDLRRYQSIILSQVIGDKSKRQSVDEIKKAHVKFYGNQASNRYLGTEQVFRGVLVSTLECSECKHSSQKTETFLDLSLPVMVEKPQPPIFHKKNHTTDNETYDISGNPIVVKPSKHQLKKEKNTAIKNRRKNRKKNDINIHNNSNNSNNNNNNNENNNSNDKSVEECSGSVFSCSESEESDADIEDNVEADDNGKSSMLKKFGWENNKELSHEDLIKIIDDRLSPMIDLNNEIDDFNNMDNINNTNNDENFNDLILADVPLDPMMIDGLSNNCDYAKNIMDSPIIDDNNINNRSQSSSTNSLNVNCESSPERMNISPLESPDTSMLIPHNINDDISSSSSPLPLPLPPTSTSSLSLILTPTPAPPAPPPLPLPLPDISTTNKTRFSDAETDECCSPPEIDNNNKKLLSLNNGIVNVTRDVTKLSLNSQQSSTRYNVKDGDCSIQSCLNQFTQLELMTGSNKVGCEACTARENKKDGKLVCTPSTKQYLVSKVPPVLILHLKRFQSQRFGFRKLSKHVSFPLLLDLSPVCKYHDKPKIYSLYGLVEHSGTMHGGHYVAYVKARKPLDPDDPRWEFLPKKNTEEVDDNSSDTSSDFEIIDATDSTTDSTKVEPPPGRWYYVSDSRVVEIDEATVLSKEAYLLFYERIQ
ncbi:hypothetical protein HCN44_011119 [Aphidius gifuensis]|uniref:Ubiquitin carboxyl-terminal hydrolase n=1 Tax=Aphidius gifuensis TaxID=684658 RepID=A0A834XX98_APHGI|nr:ubiquitin carboxyl-terminal hydrolase 16 [Aphidius gifuensis]KAF7993850.1 hypothetical protein HCN44_011119 [Aphidius gifuensis]